MIEWNRRVINNPKSTLSSPVSNITKFFAVRHPPGKIPNSCIINLLMVYMGSPITTNWKPSETHTHNYHTLPPVLSSTPAEHPNNIIFQVQEVTDEVIQGSSCLSLL